MSTTADFVREMLDDEENGEEFALSYLKEGFITSAMNSLFRSRRKANMTQEEVAAKLKTKQPAIARLEADASGSVTLKRFVEFLMACDMVPMITLAAKESAIEYIRANPDKPQTAEAYLSWHMADAQILPTTFPTIQGTTFSTVATPFWPNDQFRGCSASSQLQFILSQPQPSQNKNEMPTTSQDNKTILSLSAA